MDEDRFWAVIQKCHDAFPADMERKGELVRQEIARLSKSEAALFFDLCDGAMDLAYSWELWGAAYVINGGCGDDTFMDFRASLISRGRSVFEKATSNPDALADEEFDPNTWFYEGFQYDVSEAVQAVLGHTPKRRRYRFAPSGSKWTEDMLSTLYPRLSTKFG